MPQYRRAFLPGGTYFFTVVTYTRLPILTSTKARELLRNAWLDVCERFPFETVAVCLLPDHLHTIWKLPEEDSNYAVRWKEIKRLFTKAYLEKIGPGENRNASRLKRHEAAIWQRRFWEHLIRDQDDLCRHIEYIHYNPLKHQLVKRVADWPWSSFHRFVKDGIYHHDWGSEFSDNAINVEFGE